MTRPTAQTLREARIDLAAALRCAERQGLSEGICNHFSFVVPGCDDRFLVNPHGRHWREVTASSLLLVGSDGALLEGDAPPEPTAFYIHWRLHRAVPQARCVLHTHMPWTTAIALLEEPELLPIGQTSLMFYERIGYDPDYNGLALDAAEGDRMAARLGNKDVLLLANHGVIVTGRTVHEAYNRLYYLERAAMHQVMAMSTGRPLKLIAPEVCRKTAQQMAEDDGQPRLHFEALKRLLDRESPDYRT
jgi:ribulose-5-phosphate 4-epimerase/fuculose-1-phosphate aldolase